MTTYRVRFDDGTVDHLAGRTLTQAFQAAVTLKPGRGFTIREATEGELAALLAAHSLDLEEEEETDE